MVTRLEFGPSIKVALAVMIRLICFDLGDTLIVEESTRRDERGVAVAADVLPGSCDVLTNLKEKGYRLGLVGNGDSAGARHILRHTGLGSLFDVVSISAEVGCEKPDSRIFQLTLARCGVCAHEAVMVGNRLDADVAGANRAGMTSIWFHWNERYESRPQSSEEKPHYVINSLSNLLEVLGNV